VRPPVFIPPLFYRTLARNTYRTTPAARGAKLRDRACAAKRLNLEQEIVETMTTRLCLRHWAVVVSLASAPTIAAANPVATALSGGVLGAVLSPNASKHDQAEELLKRARQATQEGNFETADSLISQADALDVKYAPLTLSDTPKKGDRCEARDAQAIPVPAVRVEEIERIDR
jgi:hypothetical protein